MTIDSARDCLVELLDGREPRALLTAAAVAQRLSVERGWVYAHATELGAVRLGGGPRSRLRFDPAVIAERLTPRPNGPPRIGRPTGRVAGAAPLLPIKPSRSRTLGRPT